MEHIVEACLKNPGALVIIPPIYKSDHLANQFTQQDIWARSRYDDSLVVIKPHPAESKFVQLLKFCAPSYKTAIALGLATYIYTNIGKAGGFVSVGSLTIDGKKIWQRIFLVCHNGDKTPTQGKASPLTHRIRRDQKLADNGSSLVNSPYPLRIPALRVK